MITRNFVLGSALLLPLFGVQPAAAQRVRADIIIGGGPIAGRVTIGDHDRDGYRGRPRAIGHIEWVRARDYRRDDWWRDFQRGSRLVIVYWDRDDDAYYLDRYRPDLVELRMYERGGRFYRLEDDGYGARYDDRYDVRVNGRFDNRYNDRSNQRYDNRGERPRDDRFDNRRDGRDDRRDSRRDGRQNNRRDNRRDNHRDGRPDHRDDH